MRRAVVVGIGAYLPQRIVTNAELESLVETSHKWIVERTGIEERHIVAEGEMTSDLAVHAGMEAITNAGLAPGDVDMVIVATTTPDDTMPSTAVKVQHRLGITRGAAFDMNAACSGFVYAVSVANSFIVSGQARTVMVIGAETYSRILDWKDRSTCILFGDGAAAIILRAEEQPGQNTDRGILAVTIESDGQYAPLLGTNGGISSTKTAGTLFMAGKDIYRHAVHKMPEAVLKALDIIGLPITAIDWLAPHQANLRILDAVAHKLGIDGRKSIAAVQKHANTSAASIPLALHGAVKDGRIQPGQLIACPALGAGLTWGCFIIRW
jgi:3-oxoacyl-[acyl-carrier-protein] synthase-3